MADGHNASIIIIIVIIIITIIIMANNGHTTAGASRYILQLVQLRAVLTGRCTSNTHTNVSTKYVIY